MTSPADAIGHCLTRYAGFSGKAGRAEFWWFALFVLLGAIVFSRLDATLGLEAMFAMPQSLQPRPGIEPLFTYQAPGPITALWLAAIALPFLAAATRRLRDRDMGPGWLILLIVPIAGWVVLITFLGLGQRAELDARGLPQDSTLPGE
ncbi:MAG: DUF805 domain-containing protein [Pseudomonadota bacterium]